VQEAGFLISRTLNCIGVLDIESHRYRRAACSEEARRYPEFISEDKIVFFAEETTETKTGRGEIRKRKLFVMNLADMAEKQAVAASFYAPSSPRSLGDGQHVVISDFGFITGKYIQALKKYPKERPMDDLLRISVTDGNFELINPVGVKLIGPILSLKSGRVYSLQRWSSAAAKGFVHDVQVIGPEGAQRITQFEQYIWGMDVSPDERFLALSVATPDRKVKNGQLLLYEIETKQFQKLDVMNRDELRISRE